MTTNTTKKSAAVLGTIALALSLAACGAGGDAGAQPDQSTASASMSASPSASANTSGGMEGGASEDMPMPASTGDPFADARTAAAHMPKTAETLATGFATAADVGGDPSSDAATVRATLTAQLQ